MGPRHYSRGNLINSIEDVFFNKVVSMGPRHYSRGNDGNAKKLDESNAEFQWGHDITVVETIIDVFTDLFQKIVSMGPRHYSRGN